MRRVVYFSVCAMLVALATFAASFDRPVVISGDDVEKIAPSNPRENVILSTTTWMHTHPVAVPTTCSVVTASSGSGYCYTTVPGGGAGGGGAGATTIRPGGGSSGTVHVRVSE